MQKKFGISSVTNSKTALLLVLTLKQQPSNMKIFSTKNTSTNRLDSKVQMKLFKLVMLVDVYHTTDKSGLAAQRTKMKNPDEHRVPETPKEPLGPVVRQGDNVWEDIAYSP